MKNFFSEIKDLSPKEKQWKTEFYQGASVVISNNHRANRVITGQKKGYFSKDACK